MGDHDADFDGEYLYQFPTGPNHPDDIEPRGRGIGIIYKYETEKFDLVSIGWFKVNENEIITDQNIAVINNRIYLGTEYVERPPDLIGPVRKPELNKISPQTDVNLLMEPRNVMMHLRILDKDLALIDERNLEAKIKNAWTPNRYQGMGASQLYADGYYCIVTSCPIGNTSYFDNGGSRGARQIFVIRYDDRFNFVDSKGPLTDNNNDNYWPTGSWYEDSKYYISYTYRKPGEGCVLAPKAPVKPGTFKEDQGNIRLSIFDEGFNELTTFDVTNMKCDPEIAGNAGYHRSSVLKKDDNIYVSYDGPGGVWVRELILKDRF